MKKIINSMIFIFTILSLAIPNNYVYANDSVDYPANEHDVELPDYDLIYEVQSNGNIVETITFEDVDEETVEMVRTISPDGRIVGYLKKNNVIKYNIDTMGSYSEFLEEATGIALLSYCDMDTAIYTHYFIGSESEIINQNEIIDVQIDGVAGALGVFSFLGMLPGTEAIQIAMWAASMIIDFLPGNYVKLIVNTYEVYEKNSGDLLGNCYHMTIYECTSSGSYISGGMNSQDYVQSW